jgi:hypothetical protein
LRLVVLENAVVDGWGDPVPELRADLAGFERVGPQAATRTCLDLLRRAGAPTRRGRGSGSVPAGLRRHGVTRRELDVLELVETHVANLLAKLGAANRTELGARYHADADR